MEKLFYVALALIVLVCLLLIIYIVCYNQVQKYKIRINEAESVIDDKIRARFDILLQINNILINNYKVENRQFNELNNYKKQKISNFDLDRKITELVNLYKQIKNDLKDVDIKTFKEIDLELRLSDEHLEAAKAFYNNYTSKLNTLIKTFPTNIIANFHHIKPQAYFDGKNLNDDDINDFKL